MASDGKNLNETTRNEDTNDDGDLNNDDNRQNLQDYSFDKERDSNVFGASDFAFSFASTSQLKIHCRRRVYNQDQFDELYKENLLMVKKTSTREKILKCSKRLKSKTSSYFSSCSLIAFLSTLFPCIRILQKYERSFIAGDILSGLTISVMHIPQGLAYAMLASLTPVYGLYLSLFPTLVYFIFGTSRHISIGSFAVAALIMGAVVDRELTDFLRVNYNLTISSEIFNVVNDSSSSGKDYDSSSLSNIDENDPKILQAKVTIALSVTLLCGIFQLFLGLIRFGFITTYLSDSTITGFVTGVACHVLTAQLKFLFGLHGVTRQSGLFKVIRSWIDAINHIDTINWFTVGISAICCVTLYLIKVCINQRFKKKMFMPVPIELLVIIIVTACSYFVDFEARFAVVIVKNIPSGIPTPVVPDISLWPRVISDAITLTFITYAVSISLGSVFARKHGYSIDPNQELIAFGITNITCPFFHCYIASGALSRSVVQESTGGNTQIAGLVSSTVLLLVLLFAGPLLEPLPKCVLSSIVLVALRPMFLQFKELPSLYKISTYDFFTWIICFLAVVILDVDIGLIIGVVFSFFMIIVRFQTSCASILGNIAGTDLYKDSKIYPVAKEISGIRIFRFGHSLMYANKDRFLSEIRKHGQFKLMKKSTLLHGSKAEKEGKKSITDDRDPENVRTLTASIDGNVNNKLIATNDIITPQLPNKKTLVADNVTSVTEDKSSGQNQNYLKYFVIDCTPMNFVDSAGIRALTQTITEFEDRGVEVFLTNCRASLRHMFEMLNFYSEKFGPERLFLTNHDAVTFIVSQMGTDGTRARPTEVVNKAD